MATTIANRAIKARGKASPDRIQQNIRNRKVIKNSEILDNDILHIAATEELTIADLPDGNISVPLSFWLQNKAALLARVGVVAVQIAADETPDELTGDLSEIAMIVLPFVTFADGRHYSHAHKLRVRHAYKGEIRAVGDVTFDQLGFLRRVGVDTFELRKGADHKKALKAFDEFSEVYQPAADGEHLIFSKRRKIH